MFFSRKKAPAQRGPRGPLRATLRVPDVGDSPGELLDLGARGAGVSVPSAQAPDLAVGDVVELLFGRDRRPRVSTPARVAGIDPIGREQVRFVLDFIDEGDLLPQLEGFCRASFKGRNKVRLPMKGRHVGVSLWWPGGRCTATVCDLSEGGMGFSASYATSSTLEPDMRVRPYFRLPGVARPFEGPATVRYAVKLEGRRLFGLEFDLSDPSGLVRRLPEMRAFIAKRAAEVDAWEAGWAEG